MYYVYMIKNSYGKLYVGISKNPKQRLYLHNNKQGPCFTRVGRFSLVFLEKYATLAEVRKREIQIKKWRRKKKEMLINRYKAGLPTK